MDVKNFHVTGGADTFSRIVVQISCCSNAATLAALSPRWLTRRRVAGVLAVTTMMAVGCTSKVTSPSTTTSATVVSTAVSTEDVERIVAAVVGEDGAGPALDPVAMEAAEGPVLPEGAELTPDPVSVFVEGDQATIDVSVEVDGKTPSRYWAFLHEVDGKWRIYATMPLDPLKLDGVPQPSSTVTARESSDG